jgi:prepilin-type N-terminal cleavage/methylation domain-containing protein
MTCRPKTSLAAPFRRPPGLNCGKGGFTLIEIVVVLAIIGVIIGGSIAAMLLNSSERTLTSASGEIELLAKKARTASILHQRPYAIEFHSGSLRLLPFSEASEIERTTALGNPIGGEAESGKTLREEIPIDPDIVLSVRRWNTDKFITPTDNSIPIWRFDPDGLSEPLTVRLTIGESYAQDTYHPLTATVADSELEAK